LVILAVLSFAGGFMNIPEVLFGSQALHNFLSPVVTAKPEAHHLAHSTEWLLMGTIVLLTVVVIAIAHFMFVRRKQVPIQEGQLKPLHKLLYHKYYVDEIYDAFIVKPVHWLGSVFDSIVEKLAIDRLVNGTGSMVVSASKLFRRLQTGSIGFYIFIMVISIVVMLALKTMEL
jgi:NADH-quinone oxidoreductase subunit L